VKRRALRIAHRYWNSLLDQLTPFKTTEVEGLKFYYFRRDWPPQDPKDFAFGVEFHDRIRNLSGRVAVDIGANIGSYTIPLAKRFQGVTSFEPSHKYCRVLRLNIALNNLENVSVYEMALSDLAGMMPLYDRHGGSTSLDPSLYGLRYDKVSRVRTARLDDFLSRFARLDFMKVDAEGLEGRILNGGSLLISSLKPIIAMEVHRARVRLERSCGCDVCNQLSSLGYALEVTGESISTGAVHWVWAVPVHGDAIAQGQS
jgi:FkbM family methyltransferase